MSSNKQSLVLLHSSVFLFGITALFSKLIPLSSADINVFRSFLSVATLGLLILLQKRALRLESFRDLKWMLGLGVILGAHWLTYFHSMQVSSVAIGVISLYTFPLMVVFLEPLLANEKLHWSDAALAVIGLLGVFLMVPSFSLDSPITEGVLWGLLSALFFALRNTWQKHKLSHYPGDTTMLYQALFAGFVCLPFMTASVGDIDQESWLKILILGTLFTALPHSLFVASLRKLRAKTASLIACMQPVYATILAFVFINETPTMGTILGGLLIIGASMIETYRAR